MDIEKNTIRNGLNFFYLSLYAFAGVGLEALLAYLIEPLIYAKNLNDFSMAENILHWILTCIMWAVVSLALIKVAKKNILLIYFH